MKLIATVCLILLASAAIADPASRRLEASMVVTGWVEVAQDGSVLQYTLDHSEKLDVGVVNLVAQTIKTWKFQPIIENGKAIIAKARMNLRVVASQQGGDQYEIRVRGATLGDGEVSHDKENGSDNEDNYPSYKSRKPPPYPIVAIRAGTSGTVYLALEVDHTGRVEQAIATQVNLRASGNEADMRALRQVFANASVAAAKEWTFDVPRSGRFAAKDDWTALAPVNFTLSGAGQSQEEKKYGQWDVYVPGPVTPIPWDQDQVATSHNADAVADDGSLFVPDKRFTLVTPAGG